jgi:hypothetical protein
VLIAIPAPTVVSPVVCKQVVAHEPKQCTAVRHEQVRVHAPAEYNEDTCA